MTNMRKFNVTGLCTLEEDYMVDISGKIEQIKQLIDKRSYFTINRARQYGKTTTLNELSKTLADEYIVISICFQEMGEDCFKSSELFCKAFIESKHTDIGYLLTFDFRKSGNRVQKAEWIEVEGKRIFDVMV